MTHLEFYLLTWRFMYSFGLIPSTDQARNFMFLGVYLGCLVDFTGYNSEM